MLGYFLDNQGFISYVDYVDENTIGNYTTEQIPAGLNKPKWDGVKWVEGMSTAELDEIHAEERQQSADETTQADLQAQITVLQEEVKALQDAQQQPTE